MHSLRVFTSPLTYSVKNYVRTCVTSKATGHAETKELEESSILIEKHRDLMLIGINRREKKNSLDVTTMEHLHSAIQTFEENKDALSAVLYGIGGNFCAGYDLNELANLDMQEGKNVPQFGSLATRVRPFKKPIVAALSGYTLGIGLEIALMCDMRVMEETALLGFANRRFGIPIVCGGTVRLPALIGLSRATELILTGRMINAAEAHAWGVVNFQVACGAALGQAMQVAQSLVKFPQRTMLADRTSMYFGVYAEKEFEKALHFEKNNAAHLIFDEGIEGAKKFVEKGIGKHGKTKGIRDEDSSIRDLDNDYV